MAKFNKADLINKVASTNEITKVDAEKHINNVFAGLEELLADMTDGDKLQLVGLLSVEVKHVPAYIAKNPKTGEKVEVPDSNKLKIKAGKNLIDRVQ